jgi:hypothetical protein
LEEIPDRDSLGLLQHVTDVVAFLFGCITEEHVEEVEGDAILKRLHTLLTLFLVLVPL